MSLGEQRLNSNIDAPEPDERTALLHESPIRGQNTLDLFTEMEMCLQVAILKVCRLAMKGSIYLI
jgi:hypothetical protein